MKKTKLIKIFFWGLIFSSSIISCQQNSFDDIDFIQDKNEDEYVDIPIEVTTETLNTRALEYAEVLHSVAGNIRVVVPEGVSCRVYYNNQLLACSNMQHPTDNMITNYVASTGGSSPSFRFTIRFNKLFDPSKVKLAFAGQFDSEDPFADSVDDNSYLSNSKNRYINNFFGIYTLGTSNNWDNIQKTFTLKNISSVFYILTDEFMDSSKKPDFYDLEQHYSNYFGWIFNSLLDCKESRDYKEYANFGYPPQFKLYRRTSWNYIDNKVSIVSHDTSFDNMGNYGNEHPSQNYYFVDKDKVDYYPGEIVNYNGRKLNVLNGAYTNWGYNNYVFSSNWVTPKLSNGGNGLLNSSDNNQDVKYLKVTLTPFDGLYDPDGNTYDHNKGVSYFPIYTCNIPIPSGGFKQNCVYIISNKPGTSMFQMEKGSQFVTRVEDDTDSSLIDLSDNIIIDEYPLQ